MLTSHNHGSIKSATCAGRKPRVASRHAEQSPQRYRTEHAFALALALVFISLTRLDLTGSTPQPASTSLAGTTHDLPLKTQYYTATVPVWIDLVASPDEWAASFLSDEAGEVLAVLGGLVVVFALADAASDEARSFIQHVGEVVNKGLGGWEWDGVRLAVGVGDGESDEWDELCAEAGLEFVQVGGQARVNEFGGEFMQCSGFVCFHADRGCRENWHREGEGGSGGE